MTDATRSALSSGLDSQFDKFLFASIGVDGNGRILSVLSALARLGTDPWEEAKKLTVLPRAVASQRLSALIATLPDMPSPDLSLPLNADRLIALLPKAAASGTSPRETFKAVGGRIRPRTVVYIAAALLAIFLGIHYIRANQHPPPPPVDAPGIPGPSGRGLSR